jgi:large subunit ribosomal protein L14e
MAGFDVGRICVKLSGREAGKKCVVLDIIDKNFALVTGPPKVTSVKRRRVNIEHIEATPERVEIKKGATDEEVAKVLEKAKKTSFMKSEVKPSLS